jgi:hypothetical protein
MEEPPEDGKELSFGILSTCPNNFSLWDLINLIILFRFIRSTNSSLVLILHRPFNSLVAPKIFLNIFLPDTMSFTVQGHPNILGTFNHPEFHFVV